MGLDCTQFRQFIVRPALISIGLHSDAAEILITGTAMVESRLSYLKQINGPAVSIMQIEPATYKDLRKTLMEEYSKLHSLIKAALYMDLLPLEPDYLMGNISAAVMFARLKYYFNAAPLPLAEDWKGLAAYHKKIYNTTQGATELEKSESIFKSVMLGVHYPY